MKNINEYNLIKGFSLIEVMITLIILSVATVALAPMVTKKFPENKNYGVLYTYMEGNNISDSNKCFVSNSNTGTNYVSTYDCSKYTFKVPDGVGFVNLTLVGGGGGGGGGGGSYIYSSYVQNGTVTGQFTRSGTLTSELLKSIVINYLTSWGTAASDTCNPKCASSNTICGQKGGTSAPSLGDYSIPFTMIHGYNYKNPLKLNGSNNPTLAYYLYTTDYDSSKGNSYLTFTNSQDSSGLGPKFYAVYKSSYSGYTRGNSNYLYYTYGNTTKKTFPHEYEKAPVDGDYGACVKPDDTVYYKTNLMGGLGGRNDIASSFGSGVGGRSCIVYCGNTASSCLAKNASCLKDGDAFQWTTTSTSGDTTTTHTRTWSCSNGTCGASSWLGAGVKFTYTYESPGGGGGGGAAGTFVRITGFPVSQGETYTIYVGKGGDGGQGGVSGSKTAGSSGTGGVSTAIFNSSGKPVFMAMGGNYGAGGTARTFNSTAALSVATSGRNYSAVAYGANYKDNVIVDTNLMTLGSSVNNPSGTAGAKSLTYSAFDASPYKGMNMNGNTSADGKYGGFSNLSTEGQYYSGVTITNKESASTVGAPDGLFYRTLLDGEQNSGYIGGLGGFTGFGGKAGCGGYFLGNFDGRSGTSDVYTTTSPTTTYSSWLKNTFIPQNSSGLLYSVFKYYDNCTNETPNGQTADFVAPDPVAMTYGQAGAGGGGGGTSIINGSGSGGNGQNGYLMIDWRK